MPTNILRNPEKSSIPTCTRNSRTMAGRPTGQSAIAGETSSTPFHECGQSVGQSPILLSLSNMFTFRTGKGHVFVSSAYWAIGWLVGRCWCSGYLEVVGAFENTRHVLSFLYHILRPRAGSGVVRIDPLRFLAGCRTRPHTPVTDSIAANVNS